MQGKSLAQIVSLSETVQLPKPFEFLRKSESVRGLFAAAAETVRTTLETELGADQLEADRVLVKDANGGLELSSILAAPFMVLRHEKGGMPSDIVSRNGRLTDCEPPALHCTEDHVTRARAAKQKFVLATCSSGDLALLRMLKLPVTPACGLGKITAKQALCLFADGKQPAGPSKSSGETIDLPHDCPKIILVAAGLFERRNQFPDGFLLVASQFQRIERTMKRKVNAGVWLPSAAEFRHFCDAVQLADPQLVSDAITSSVGRSVKSIEEFFEITSGPRADDVLRARKKLLTAIEAFPKAAFGTRDVAAALDEYCRANEIAINEQIRREVMVAATALDKSFLTVAGDLIEMQFQASELVQRAKAIVDTGKAANIDTPIEERLEFQLRIADGLAKIRRGLDRNK